MAGYDVISHFVPSRDMNAIGNWDHGVVSPNTGGFLGMQLTDSVNSSSHAQRKHGHRKHRRLLNQSQLYHLGHRYAQLLSETHEHQTD